MKIHRIKGIILRHLYQIKHDTGALIAPFYWPLIDVLLWGLTSVYIQSIGPGISKIIISVVSAAVLWLLVYRSFFDFTVSIIFERWDKNLINLFASPLKVSEWITGVIIFGIVRVIAGFIFITAIALFLYKVNITMYGLYLVPFIFMLMISGWWIGFLVSGFNLLHGRKAEILVWTVTALISPFSAIYYPVSTLPKWAQSISYMLPQSYIFEGMREIINTGKMDTQALVISGILNIVYITFAVLFFRWCFSRLLKSGLVNVY